jgi:hypothetical protein
LLCIVHVHINKSRYHCTTQHYTHCTSRCKWLVQHYYTTVQWCKRDWYNTIYYTTVHHDVSD